MAHYNKIPFLFLLLLKSKRNPFSLTKMKLLTLLYPFY